MARKAEKKEMTVVTRKCGTYQAFDREGTVFWESAGFVAGVSLIPNGISMAMKAGRIVDDSGHTVHVWDPGGMLGENK